MNSTRLFVNLNDTNFNLSSTDWNSTVTNTNDIFYMQPTIYKIICELFNWSSWSGIKTHAIFTHLNQYQRHIVYKTLSYFKFTWNKSNDAYGKTIWVEIKDCWNIPSTILSHIIRSPTKRNSLQNLYRSLTLISHLPNGNIIVTMDDFVKYHIINNKYYNDTGSNYTVINSRNLDITYTDNSIIDNFITDNSITDYTTKKLQLSDMIFDIKDDITDLMFKTIMDKLAEL